MTTEEKRIKIAEACGWKPEVKKLHAGIKNVKGWGKNTHLPAGDLDRAFAPFSFSLPDYFEDRQAIAPVIQILGKHNLAKWATHLQTIMGEHAVGYVPDHVDDLASLGRMVLANANDMAEAFGLTLGLWKEG